MWFDQHLAIADNGIQRTAELVTDVGEIAFQILLGFFHIDTVFIMYVKTAKC